MGMGQKLNKQWEWGWEWESINQDGNGNDFYSHGNGFPSTAEEKYCRI